MASVCLAPLSPLLHSPTSPLLLPPPFLVSCFHGIVILFRRQELMEVTVASGKFDGTFNAFTGEQCLLGMLEGRRREP